MKPEPAPKLEPEIPIDSTQQAIDVLTRCRKRWGGSQRRASIDTSLQSNYVSHLERFRPPVNIRIETFIRLLALYGYELVVRRRAPTTGESPAPAQKAVKRA